MGLFDFMFLLCSCRNCAVLMTYLEYSGDKFNLQLALKNYSQSSKLSCIILFYSPALVLSLFLQ